jgi:hypothetical protein
MRRHLGLKRSGTLVFRVIQSTAAQGDCNVGNEPPQAIFDGVDPIYPPRSGQQLCDEKAAV